MTELLQKKFPGSKDVDRHMMNNVRLRTRRENVRIGFKEYSDWS